MKRSFLLLFIVFSSVFVASSQDLSAVDQKVMTYKKSTVKHPDRLAERINNDFGSELEKARAIYTWIANHVDYDVEGLRNGAGKFSFSYRTLEELEQLKRQHNKELAVKTFKNGKAVCEGYSQLFQYLCDLTGIECVVISGSSKTKPNDIGKTPSKSDHAWNAVRIGNEWLLMDATWGAGYVNGNEFVKDFSPLYFDMPASKFDLKHYPSESKWLFSNISKEQFANSPLFFRTYFESTIELLLPKEGIIRAKAEKTLSIRIKSKSPSPSMYYHFTGEKYSKPLEFTKIDGFYEAKIIVPKNRPSNLTLFGNGESLVMYRLVY